MVAFLSGGSPGVNENAAAMLHESQAPRRRLRRRGSESVDDSAGRHSRKQQRLIASAIPIAADTLHKEDCTTRLRNSSHKVDAGQGSAPQGEKQRPQKTMNMGILYDSDDLKRDSDTYGNGITGRHRMQMATGRDNQERVGSGQSLHIVPEHPLGVLPEGNALLDSAGVRSQSMTMGLFARLPHDVIINVMGMLSPVDLTRLERTSSAMRAFAAHEPVWREALIQYTDGHLSCWSGSWKATMAAHHRLRAGRLQESDGRNDTPQLDEDGPRRRPFSRTVFSNVLYLPIQLASLPLARFIPKNVKSSDQSITPTQTGARPRTGSLPSPFRRIQREPMRDLMQDSFLARFATNSLPCLLTDNPQSRDQDLPRWTIDDLQRLYPSRRIRAEALTMSMTSYAAYANTCHVWERRRAHWTPDESPFYLFDPTLARTMQKQGRFVVPRLFRETVQRPAGDQARSIDPAAIAEPTPTEHQSWKGTMKQSWDLFSLLHDRRPDHAWVIAGPKRSGSGWHVDPNHTSAYNTVLSGSKLWMLLPPHITPPGVYISEDGATVTAPLSIAEWLTDFWSACVQRHGRKGDDTLVVDVCGPGETIYVPAGWKHLVVNLEDSVAFTQNFVSPTELPAVLDFLKNRPDQISGFRVPRRRPLVAGRPDYGEAAGDESDPELDDLPGGGLAEKSKLFDLFVERLSSFDRALCEQGVQAMRMREEARRNEARHRVPSNWWRMLKEPLQLPCDSSEGQCQPQSVPFCLAPSGEELEEIPW